MKTIKGTGINHVLIDSRPFNSLSRAAHILYLVSDRIMADSSVDALRSLAITAFKAGHYDLALEKFNALCAVSKHPFDNRWLTLTLHLLGRYSDACDALNIILRGDPDDTFALYHLSHIKASCEDQSLRNGPMAVKLSTRLCEISEWKNWGDLSMLAAAHAEVGDWESAQRFASSALEFAPENEKARREDRFDMYREHRPYRSSTKLDHSHLIYQD